jgi:hypothetical protein
VQAPWVKVSLWGFQRGEAKLLNQACVYQVQVEHKEKGTVVLAVFTSFTQPFRGH